MNKISKIILSVFSVAFLLLGSMNTTNAATYTIQKGTTCGSGTNCDVAATGDTYCQPGLVCGKDADNTCKCMYANEVLQTQSGMSSTPLPTVVGNVIKVILGLTGTIALIFIIWGGIRWMVSKGDASKIADARKLMVAGVIGLAIIAAAYAISDFVIKQITTVAQ